MGIGYKQIPCKWICFQWGKEVPGIHPPWILPDHCNHMKDYLVISSNHTFSLFLTSEHIMSFPLDKLIVKSLGPGDR